MKLFAWIIGWDLVLEYALSATTVAIGWSGYVGCILGHIGIPIPARLSAASGSEVTLADGSTVTALFNLPAVLIVVLVAALLVKGVEESARVNDVIVFVKFGVILLFILFAWRAIDGANWQPFIPPNAGDRESFGSSGIIAGAGIVFFAYIGFDAVSTAA